MTTIKEVMTLMKHKNMHQNTADIHVMTQKTAEMYIIQLGEFSFSWREAGGGAL